MYEQCIFHYNRARDEMLANSWAKTQNISSMLMLTLLHVVISPTHSVCVDSLYVSHLNEFLSHAILLPQKNTKHL